MEIGEFLASKYAEKPDPSLEARLVSQYEKLIFKIAQKYKGRAEFQSLAQAGRVGLLKAIRSYKTSKDTKFETLAYHYIDGYIAHYLRDGAERGNDQILPTYLVEFKNRINQATEELTILLNRTPTEQEIAQQVGITQKRYRNLVSLIEKSPSVNQIPQPKDRLDQKVFQTPIGMQSDYFGRSYQSTSVAMDIYKEVEELRHSGATISQIAQHFNIEPDKAGELAAFIDSH